VEDKLIKDKYTYMAKVKSTNQANLNDVMRYMSESSFRSHLADAIRVPAHFQTALEAMLLEGYSITTPFARFKTIIRGVFRDYQDSFDSKRHELRPNVSAGQALRESYRIDARAKKIPAPQRVTPKDYLSD